MPYWRREAALRRTLDGYERLYPSLNMEVVVAVDGCEVPELKRYPFPVTFALLPRKEDAKNPCVPINEGVRQSVGSVVAITNPENYHKAPIFGRMLEELVHLGPAGYVLASCWGETRGEWQCHPLHTTSTAPLPEGGGLHFCAMMYRKFFNEIGGFDEDYRDGAGYEDNDFVWRAHLNGARFSILEDCVVYHEKSTTGWKGFGRNRKLFHEKWMNLL